MSLPTPDNSDQAPQSLVREAGEGLVGGLTLAGLLYLGGSIARATTGIPTDDIWSDYTPFYGSTSNPADFLHAALQQGQHFIGIVAIMGPAIATGFVGLELDRRSLREEANGHHLRGAALLVGALTCYAAATVWEFGPKVVVEALHRPQVLADPHNAAPLSLAFIVATVGGLLHVLRGQSNGSEVEYVDTPPEPL